MSPEPSAPPSSISTSTAVVAVVALVVVAVVGGILFSVADEISVSVAVIEGGWYALLGYMGFEKLLLLLTLLLLLVMDVAAARVVEAFKADFLWNLGSLEPEKSRTLRENT